MWDLFVATPEVQVLHLDRTLHLRGGSNSFHAPSDLILGKMTMGSHVKVVTLLIFQ